MLDAKKCSDLAEREGFEPSVPGKGYARLAIYFRPANTRTLARLLETENPCGCVTCRIRVGREVSQRVSPDLVQSGKFSPPCAHPTGLEAREATRNQNALSTHGRFFNDPHEGVL